MIHCDNWQRRKRTIKYIISHGKRREREREATHLKKKIFIYYPLINLTTRDFEFSNNRVNGGVFHPFRTNTRVIEINNRNGENRCTKRTNLYPNRKRKN